MPQPASTPTSYPYPDPQRSRNLERLGDEGVKSCAH
jgi:hypothetical protein